MFIIEGTRQQTAAQSLARRAHENGNRWGAGATVLLTSHYMADVEALCKRVIIIHNGGLLFDSSLVWTLGVRNYSDASA